MNNSMYTQCPHCQHVQSVEIRALSAGRGQLHCDECGRVFDALERLVEDRRELQATALQDEPDLFSSQMPVSPERLTGGNGEPFEEDLTSDAALLDEAPHFLLDQQVVAMPHGGRWWLGVVLFAVILSAQLVLSQRAQLAEDPGLRPWLQRLCAAVHCDLPAFRDPAQIHLLTRDIQPHPSVPDALLISASFRNDANWPQAWPTLELSLSDLDGRLVALRRFTADEYLGQKASTQLLDAGQPVAIELELVDPGKQAIAYEFNFL